VTSTAVEAYLSQLERELRKRGLQDPRIVDEAREHLLDAVEGGLQRGLSVDAAECQALVRFGAPEMVAAQFATKRHRMSTADGSWSRFSWASDAVRDARDGLRAMRRNPGFTAVVILTLATGTGATTAVFSVVNALLLRPLPYPNSRRLVQLIETLPGTETSAGNPETPPVMNVQEFVKWRSRTKTLSDMAVYADSSFTVSTPDGAVRASAARVSPALFAMLGGQPTLGRTLDESDEGIGSNAVVVSANAWRKYLASGRDAIGRPILLDGKPHVVVGVLPDDFSFPSAQTEFWTAYALPTATGSEAFAHVLARLQDGVSLNTATAEANVIGNAIGAADGITSESSSRKFRVRRLEDAIVAPFMPALRLLVGVVALVMLIVVANAMTLLLSRHVVRSREMAIRRALGADRTRIVRQVVVESLLLSVGGCIAGIAIAGALVWLMKAMAVVDVPELFQLAARAQFGTSSVLPRLTEVRFDAVVLGFVAGISGFASVMCGLGPALQTLLRDCPSLVSGAERSTLSQVTRNTRRLGGALVIAQLAVATTLLVGAGLLIHSLVNLVHAHPGYDPANVVTFQLVLPPEYDSQRKEALANQLCSELRSLADVGDAGFTNLPPLAGGGLTFGLFVPPGRTLQDMLQERVQPQARAVSPDYLRALGVHLIDGRWFDERDRERQALLVTRATARHYFGNISPVGAQVRLLPATVPWEIIGVVDDVRPGVTWEQPYPLVFMESRQALVVTAHLPERMRDTAAIGFLSFAVRVNTNSSPIARDVRNLLRRLDPAAALDGVTTMQHLVSSSMARPRYNAVVVGLLALIASGLAALGVYAAMAYAVSQRTTEIGIRMALGAQPGDVLRLVLGEGGMIALIGVALGLVAAFAFTRYLRGLLFQVTPTNLSTYAIVSMGFSAIALAASYVPARRASMVDPLRAIRHE
jgi:putative ABC transport system permease protein